MGRIGVSELRRDLSAVLERVAAEGDHVIVHRHGRDLVAVVPLEALSAVEAMEDAYLARAADQAEVEGGERVPWEDVKRELGL